MARVSTACPRCRITLYKLTPNELLRRMLFLFCAALLCYTFPMLPEFNNFSSDPIMCNQCGGLCCQSHPGLWTVLEQFSSTFSLSTDQSQADLLSNIVQLKLTFRNLDDVLVPAPQGTSSGCIFLGPNSCELAIEKRPDQCRALTPSIDALIHGEMHCTLPPKYGSGTPRKIWRDFWSNR